MSKIERFEDIEAWRMARKAVRKTYRLSSVGVFAKDFALRDQMRRSAISVMSNIAEGFERYNNAEFIQFLNIAKGSAGEMRSQLYVAVDLKYIDGDEARELKDLCEAISRSLWNFMKYLREHKKRKTKV